MWKFKGIDDGHGSNPNVLSGIYERIKSNESRLCSGHVTQVIQTMFRTLVQQTI